MAEQPVGAWQQHCAVHAHPLLHERERAAPARPPASNPGGHPAPSGPVRIAVAAARGLSLSLNIPAIGIGTPEALAFGLPRPCRIVIPGKRDTAIWQDFTDTPSEPQQSSLDALPPGPAEATPQVSIAEGIARLARARAGTPQPRPAPIYLRPADAAPARDRGPVILP